MHTIRLIIVFVLSSATLSAVAQSPAVTELVQDRVVRSLFADLLRLGGYGHRDTELAAFLVRDPGDVYRCVMWPSRSYQRSEFRGRIPLGTVAIVHTHRNSGPQGTVDDGLTARRLRLPVYVLTLNAVYVVTPEGENVPVVQEKRWAAAARGNERCRY